MTKVVPTRITYTHTHIMNSFTHTPPHNSFTRTHNEFICIHTHIMNKNDVMHCVLSPIVWKLNGQSQSGVDVKKILFQDSFASIRVNKYIIDFAKTRSLRQTIISVSEIPDVLDFVKDRPGMLFFLNVCRPYLFISILIMTNPSNGTKHDSLIFKLNRT